MKVQIITRGGEQRYLGYVCPCGECGYVEIPISDNPATHWVFNGNLENPGLVHDPSNKYPSSVLRKLGIGYQCHGWMENGHIRFHKDSTHTMAGKTIPLPEIPEKWQKA